MFDGVVQKNLSTFLHTLASLPDGEAALWHCTQGKDRTGFATAVLLVALGADRKLIVDDFSLSNEAYKTLLDALTVKAKAAGYDDSKINILYALLGVSVPNFQLTLDTIEQRYGSLDNYLKEALGCDETLKKKLQDRFLLSGEATNSIILIKDFAVSLDFSTFA